jgi:hypothetical protein
MRKSLALAVFALALSCGGGNGPDPIGVGAEALDNGHPHHDQGGESCMMSNGDMGCGSGGGSSNCSSVDAGTAMVGPQ